MAEWEGIARALREWIERMANNDPRLGYLTGDEAKRVKEGARQALVMLLGFDLGENPQAWREWLNNHEDELDQYIDLSDSGDDDKYSL